MKKRHTAEHQDKLSSKKRRVNTSSNNEKKHRNNHRISDYFNDDHLALGAIATGLAGIGTYLLFNSQKKKSFGEKLYDTYEEYKEDAENVASDIIQKGKELYNYASNCTNNHNSNSFSLFLLGAAGGIAIGGTVAYLVNRHNGSKTSFIDKAIDVLDNIKESAHSVSENLNCDWSQKAKDILESIVEHASTENNSSRSHGNFNIQRALDLGITGYKLWEYLAKRKHQ